jgi:hypothetical protein
MTLLVAPECTRNLPVSEHAGILAPEALDVPASTDALAAPARLLDYAAWTSADDADAMIRA